VPAAPARRARARSPNISGSARSATARHL
jgi:hypothetical protein